MKRLVCLFLVFLLTFTVSCGAAPEVFDVDFSDTETEIDLDNYEFRIRFYDYFDAGEGALFGYRENTQFHDAVLKRIEDVETKLNCDIVPSNATGFNFENNFIPSVVSGINLWSCVQSASYNMRSYIEAKYFEPLSKVSDIINYHDSEKWGTWRLLEQGVWDGEIYGVVPVLWPDVAVSSGFVFAFNEKFADKLGQPDPREYLETETWTRERLGEMMRTYTTDDLGYPLKALFTYEGHFFDTALRANNAQAYKIVNGEYVSGYHTPEGFDALQWADDFLHKDYPDCKYAQDPGDETARNLIFINEYVALHFTPVTSVYGQNSQIPFEVDNFCVLPMPNGPAREGQPYTTFFECVRSHTLFPLHGDIEKAAIVADMLFEPLDGLDPESLEQNNLRYYFHDERDYYLINEIFDNQRYSYVGDGVRKLVVDELCGRHYRTVTQVLESTEEAQNLVIEEFVVPTAAFLEEIFGAEALQND